MTTTYKIDVTSTEQVEHLTFHLVNYPTCDVNIDLKKSGSLLSISSPGRTINKKDISELINCLGFKAEQTSMRLAV